MLRRTTLLLQCSIALAALATTAGCYAPTPPPGAYSCDAESPTCPDGQRCVCGQCVEREEQAACVLTAEATVPACADPPPGDPLPNCVHEHEPFAVTVTAYQKDGKTLASAYAGGLTVAGTWGNAYLHDDKVAFKNGKATIHVSLNRETIGQARARVLVRAGTASAATPGVAVVAPKLSFQKDALLLPQGWANVATMMPNVVRDDAGALRMYFAGVGFANNSISSGIGVATPDPGGDARPWLMQAQPALTAPQGEFAKDSVMGPAVFRAADGSWRMIFRGSNAKTDTSDFGLARSKDGLGGWELVSPAAVLPHARCSFCEKTVEFPSVLVDPVGPPGSLDLYFTPGLLNLTLNHANAIAHATSIDDGVTWDVDPLHVFLEGPETNDSLIGAVQVIREGSVYKMFYAYVVNGLLLTTELPCPPDLRFHIGYATSEDGQLFIRSPSNPVLKDAPPWSQSAAIVPGGAVLIDPADPTKGMSVFFSVMQTVKIGLGLCLPAGVGRATRP